MNSTPKSETKSESLSVSGLWRKLSQRSRDLMLFVLIAAPAFFGLVLMTEAYERNLNRADALTGYVLFVLFIFLGALNSRKKLSMIPLGRAGLWLAAHVVFGISAIGLFWLHAGTIWPVGFYDQLVTLMFYLVAFSGVVGFMLYRMGAGQLTQTGVEVIYERIPRELYEIREQAEQIVLECTEETGSDTLAKHYDDTLSWFFRKPRFYWQNIFGLQSAVHWMRFHAVSVVRYLDEKEAAHFDRMMALIRVKRQIDHHYAAQDLMKKWLLVHLPLSVALMILSAWHWFLVEVYVI
jgi:hypothetical protein